MLETGSGHETLGIKSFADIYKTSYSHGLESIYALETVDISSVRRIAQPFDPAKKLSKKAPKKLKKDPAQYDFDFGPGFREWVEPFFLKEPIQVLGLSKGAEKSLLDNGRNRLQHLVGADLKGFIFLKGMGQGHIFEIKQKLDEYLGGRPVREAFSLDFAAWVRALTAALPAKKIFVLLEKYHLENLITLTPADSVEVKRLSSDKKKEWRQETACLLAESKINPSLKEITDTFIKPWMEKRNRLATKDELIERLERLSDDPAICLNSARLLEDTYLGGKFLLGAHLECVEKGIYCSEVSIAEDYKSIVACAKTYFYKKLVNYNFLNLSAFIAREFSRYWKGFPDLFIDKVLKISPSFQIYKDEEGQLLISQNPSA